MKKLSDRFGKNGFTLVELTVVLVIIGILAAVGIPTAVHFIRQAEYRKNEENAKTAYLAAESTLTWYRASGEWEAFRGQVTAEGAGVLNQTFAPGDRREGRIYAVSVNHWDGGASKSGELARKLLDGGVYSGDFYDAEIVIEVDVESGQVYSAFYGTRCGSLTYEENAEGMGQCISASGNWREPEIRRESALGYYSVEDVVNVAPLKKVRLKLTTINLVNSETLSLNWSSNSRNHNLDVKYLITFYREDAAGDQKLFTTEVELSRLRGELKTAAGETGNASSKTGMAYLELKDPNKGDLSLGKWAFPLTYQQTDGAGGRFSLVLDGMMTAELAETVKAGQTAAGPEGLSAAQSVGTSITRLGDKIPALLSAQNIYAEILAQQAWRELEGEDGETVLMEVTEYKPGRAVRSNTENTLFAKGDLKTQTEADGTEFSALEAEITRFRHLSNIRYQDRNQSAVFTLTGRNLDWTSAGVGMYGFAETGESGAGAGYRTVEWQNAVGNAQILDFPSVPLLGEHHRLEGKSGAAARLTNLHLGAGSMPSDKQIGALYGTESSGQLTHYLGLFCESEGRIRNLTLLDPVLRLAGERGGSTGGTGSPGNESKRAEVPAAAEEFGALYGAGILCGRNQGSLEQIAVKTTDRKHQTVLVCLKDRPEESGQQRTPAGIGGLAGILAGKNADGTLFRLTDPDIRLTDLTAEGAVTGRLPDPDAGTGADGAASGSEDSAEERAGQYSYGIGGLFGYAWIGREDASENSAEGVGVQLTACANHADVSGNLSTGGIAGALKGDFMTGGKKVVSIRDSVNEGLILCLKDHKEEDNSLEGRYFGGILGYGDGAQISDCVNASSYRDTFAEGKKEELLRGHYAGGILGYGKNSQLFGCRTEKGSYVFGSHYVGGIAGGLSNNLAEAITGADQGEDLGIQVTTNAGYVIGYRYVGGIVGRNDGSEETTISNCVNNGVAAGYDRYIGGIVGYNGTNGVIDDCASYLSDYGGSVFETVKKDWKAAGDCTGGLAGYNNGKIKFSDANKSIQVKSISGIVIGRNYVGGIVGFNDRNGTLHVEAYELIGGRIHGSGNGVGGCIGLNASEDVLKSTFSICPSRVEGNYYVGGCIGANVVDLAEETTMKEIRTDSLLGSVAGSAFTGGVIGYQRTYTDTQVQEKLKALNPDWYKPADGSSSSGRAVLDKEGRILLFSYIEGTEDRAGTEQEKDEVLATAAGLLPLLNQATRVPAPVLESENGYTLVIGDAGNTEEGKQTVYNNIQVRSDLYTGGIVGYCERNSRLRIVNSRNSGNLSAGAGVLDGVSLKAYLESREVGAKSGELDLKGEDPKLSIGGGIIGANLEHQIIDHCVSTGIMSGFTGLGGIVGLNAGGVFNCSLSVDFGNTELDYIGGIVGLNVHAGNGRESKYTDVWKNAWENFVSGTVAGCETAEKKTVFGRSCVGGVAGYNLSGAELRSNRNSSGVTGSGDYIGGMAGVNGGRILMTEDEAGAADYTVTGNYGKGIGGIAGWNRAGGSIEVAAGNAGDEVVAAGPNVVVTGKVKVGGIIGVSEGSLSAAGSGSLLVCQAKRVHASEGYAGGIIGEAGTETENGADAAGGARIRGAVNRSGIVTADRGPAGGITAVNRRNFRLENCINLGNVNSDNGCAGGIAAENYGWITGCRVGSRNEKTLGITISCEGADAVGAVCAVNYGYLWDSAPVRSVFETGKGDHTVILSGSAGIAGGVTGRNAAGGQIGSPPAGDGAASAGYEVDYMPHIAIETAAMTVGGVAGQNQPALPGTASGENGEPPAEPKPAAVIWNMTVKGLVFEDFDHYQYLGGIVGENQDGARVEYCLFQDGQITQKDRTAAGNCYGGIAGTNDGRLLSCRIENIQMSVQGVYTATATSTAAEKEALSSHVGGIAGKNDKNGVIAGCLINTSPFSAIRVQYGMAGGVAGYNKNQILLSGGAETDVLMEQQTAGDGSLRPDVEDAEDLITNAMKNSIAADPNYVNWDGDSAMDTGDQRYYSDNGQGAQVKEGRSLTLLMTGNGSLGGIAAYNAPAGQVSFCASGRWYLNNRSEAIGVGTGGIIGMNESEKDQEFLLNQAFVGRQVAPEWNGQGKTDRFAGGIIGNQNNTTRSGWTIRNCVNYGTVYCKYTHYSGGIIGQWTGTGGNIEKCSNFGNLQTTCVVDWLGASAGVVAQLYHAYENNEYNITDCANYGNIFGRKGRSTDDCANDSAGILGNVTAYTVSDAKNAQKFTISVTDCVNGPGVAIYSKSMASGIVGFLSMDSPEKDGGKTEAKIVASTPNIRLNVERCRNYASVLEGKNFAAGIFGDRYGKDGAEKTTIKYCFSVDYGGYVKVDRDTGKKTRQPHPIVSCGNGNAVPGSINQDDKNVSNFFLSDRNEIAGFPSGELKNSLDKNGTNWEMLQRVNANWIHSFVKDGTRYFVYITEKGNPPADQYTYTIDGTDQYVDIKDKKVIYRQGKWDRRTQTWTWTETEIGEVLFTIADSGDANEYNSIGKVISRGQNFNYFHNFDTYVREFCFARADLLMAPEKAVLSRAEDGKFLLEVDAPVYAGSGEIEYAAELYRKKDENDSTGTLIPVSGMEQCSANISLEGTNTFCFSGGTCTFALSDTEVRQGGELFVKVRARKKAEPSAESSQVTSNAVPIGTVLPDPKIRIELAELKTIQAGTGTKTVCVYRFRLTNQKAYEAYQDKNILIHVKLMDGTELTFAPDGTEEYTAAADSLQQLVVWAAVSGASPGFGITSSEVSVPVYLPACEPLIPVKGSGTGSVTPPVCTAAGTSEKDLSVTVTLTGPGGSVTTPPVYRAELTGDWKDEAGTAHTDYVFRTADVLTVADGQVSAVFSGFSQDDDLQKILKDAENIRVRVWYAQSGLGPVYTYYMVDPNQETPNTRTREILDGEEEKGLQWLDAYTHVLKEAAFENYRWTSQTLFRWLPAPELMRVPEGTSLEPVIDSANGHLKYTFRWDENLSPNNNTYLVTLTGVARDAAGNPGSPVTIAANQEVTGGSYELETEDWPYEKVTLSVTRKGGYKDTDGVWLAGKTSAADYSVKKRLPRPEQPGVTNPDVNELYYEIEWNPVSPEAGPDTASGCNGYEICIRPADPDKDPVRVTVRKGDDTLSITERGSWRRQMDLEDFAGQQVRISVRALADAGDTVYVESVDGVACELTVPKRIPDPKVQSWEKSWDYKRPDPSDPDAEDETKSIGEFEGGGPGGLKVTLTADPDDPDSIPPGGSSYLTKAYVFESEADARAVQQALLGRTETDLDKVLAYYPAANVENQWIPAEMEPERTGGNRFGHTLTGLSAKYAGKYILFTARISSGGGKASSRWVIQQQADGSIWRLPYVKLPTPVVSAETGEGQAELRFSYNPDLGPGNGISADSPESEAAGGGTQAGDGGIGSQTSDSAAASQTGDGAGNAEVGEGSTDAEAGDSVTASQSGAEAGSAQTGDSVADVQTEAGGTGLQPGDSAAASQTGDGAGNAQAGNGSTDAQTGDSMTGGQAGDSAGNAQTGSQPGGGAGNTQAGDSAADAQPGDSAGVVQAGDNAVSLQAETGVPDAQADPDPAQNEEIWTAESTILAWSSVEYADAYYVTLTDTGESDGSGAVTAEFKVVEYMDETDPSAPVPAAAVYGKNTDGTGQWAEIGRTGPDLDTGTAYTFDLSETNAAFLPYGKTVKGFYALDTSTSIPYEAALKTSLEITMEDGSFIYRLTLPDSNRLNPPTDSWYENSIVNSDSDRLRFTDSVRIWSDMVQNEDPANRSSSYVKSDDHVTEFDN